ncbi:YwqJ-related putative deaminase [Streptomyces sp. NPDC127117]|uniref:YwqJ-related putative deaminase n=1 Tax=Streptomyces sp. NPDC127117 TaxID=3345368 RepID=UPI0036451B57
MSEQFPAVASSLLIGGQVVSHTSLVGEGTADLHPALRQFVETLPADAQKPFTGHCAESALVSDQLWALDSARGDGRTTTLDEAAPHFAGSAIISRMIRGQGHPDHGRATEPCEVCRLLLRKLGVDVLS